MNNWLCVVCRRHNATGQPAQTCADCSRHAAYGVIVDACVGNGVGFDVLDALSCLMGVTTRMRRQHNREMAEEQRFAQGDARAAFHDGLSVGRAGES